MKTSIMKCKNCKGTRFSIFWKYQNSDELIRLQICHDGYGLLFEDATVKCLKCGCEAIGYGLKLIEEEKVKK